MCVGSIVMYMHIHIQCLVCSRHRHLAHHEVADEKDHPVEHWKAGRAGVGQVQYLGPIIIHVLLVQAPPGRILEWEMFSRCPGGSPPHSALD